jgi:hypothetical protein
LWLVGKRNIFHPTKIPVSFKMTSSAYANSKAVHMKIVTKIYTVPAEPALIVPACTAATAKCIPIRLTLKTYLEDVSL